VKGINLVYIPTIEKKSLSQFVHSFQSILHACFRKYDIIFVVNSANGPFGMITRLLGRKTMINVDGLEWLRPKWKGFGSTYFFHASRMATRYFDVIVNDSDEMARIYMELFKAPSTVIAYGANIRYSEHPEVIEKWNLKDRDYYLIVGRLIPDNNADLIVREFLKSETRRKLVIVGDVPYDDPYANGIKATKDERIVFTGYITDATELSELYHHCFAYFHGHEFGGTNPTLLTALASGCAVMALDTPFTREMLKGKEYGLFFTKDENNLTFLMEKLEREPETLDSYREKSRERITDNYTWEKITGQYIDLFNSICRT